MARPTISQRISLEGGDQIKRAFADIGKAGEDAFSRLQKAGDKVNLTAPTAAIEAATKRTSTTIEELRQRLTGAGGAAAESGSGFLQLGSAVQSTQARLAAAVAAGARVGLAVQGIGTAFSGAFGKVGEFRQGIAEAVEGVSATVLKSAAALTSVPAAFLAIALSAANAASQIKEASIAAGTSPQEYQKLTIAAEQMGGSEEKLVAALSAINEKVQEQSRNFFGNQQRLADLREAMSKGGLAGRQAAVDFEQLRHEMELFGPDTSRTSSHIIDVDKALKGVSGNRDAIERLKNFAEELRVLPDPAERASRVAEVFGRRLGPQLVELLSGGRKAIEEMGKRAEDLGLIMTDTQFRVGKDMNDALSLLRRSLAATKNSIGLLFGPAITEAAELLTEAIGRNRTTLILWAADLAAKVRPVLLDIVRAMTGDTDAIENGWIKTSRQLIIDLGAAISNVTQNIIVPALIGLMRLLQTTAETINGLFGTKLTGADIAVVLVLGRMVGAFTLLGNVVRLAGSAFGVLRGGFASVVAVGRVLSLAISGLGGVFTALRVGIAAVAAGFGAIPLAIGAIGVAIGFLAVQLARSVNWSAFVEAARAAFAAVIGVLSGAAAAIASAFGQLASLVEAVWTSAAAAARATFAALTSAAAALWSTIRTFWQSGVSALTGLWQQVSSAAGEVFGQIAGAASALWDAIRSVWQAGTDAVGSLWNALPSVAQTVWQAILAGVTGVWDSISAVWSAGVEKITAFLTTLRDFAVGVWTAIGNAARQAFGAEQQAANASSAFAGGGPVFGQGSATSDSIPAWLSNGEFVIRAAAVRKYGLSLFNALNRMRIDPGAFARFAEGGLVSSLQLLMPPPLHFAEGGLVAGASASSSSLRPINLTIGAETFAGLLAPEDVAQKLIRASVAKQIRSAGRKPGYFGSSR